MKGSYSSSVDEFAQSKNEIAHYGIGDNIRFLLRKNQDFETEPDQYNTLIGIYSGIYVARGGNYDDCLCINIEDNPLALEAIKDNIYLYEEYQIHKNILIYFKDICIND